MEKHGTRHSNSSRASRSSNTSVERTSPPHQTLSKNYYRWLKHGILICLFLTYLIPVSILTSYFNYKFNQSMRESSKLQLFAVAESQKNTIDLFMQKKIVNVFNLFHKEDFSLRPSQAKMESYLISLIQSDDAFVDVGLINANGVQTGYAGPYPNLLNKDYSEEDWYNRLLNQSESYIVTDLYLGLRREPHFTVGIRRMVDDRMYVIRTSVYPDKLQDFVQTTSHGKQAMGFLVNQEGIYQVVVPELGELLEPAYYFPGEGRKTDVTLINWRGSTMLAAYTWLKEVPWCLVMLQPQDVAFEEMYAIRNTMIIGAAFLILGIMLFIWFIVNRLISNAQSLEQERIDLKSQLYHANKLVSVGELAGGVAHEINNPLAIIESEAGVIRDMLDPAMGMEASPEAIRKELDEINKAVRRAKGVTQKILSFVRKTEPQLIESDINQLLDEAVAGVKEQEFKVSGIQLVKDYDADLPKIYVDPDLLRQVFLNLLNNAGDVVGEGDTITLKTETGENCVKITIADTGIGMSQDVLEKIFMPFYTTKEVGKGTGLGLLICLNIVEGFGGRIQVQSSPGKGSAFTMLLPLPGRSLDNDDDNSLLNMNDTAV